MKPVYEFGVGPELPTPNDVRTNEQPPLEQAFGRARWAPRVRVDGVELAAHRLQALVRELLDGEVGMAPDVDPLKGGQAESSATC